MEVRKGWRGFCDISMSIANMKKVKLGKFYPSLMISTRRQRKAMLGACEGALEFEGLWFDNM